MIQYNIFPGGKRRIVTFSYDDGHNNDARLIELFNRYGVKGSFHLNGNRYIGLTPQQAAELRARYEGHEISCHTVRHGWLANMPAQSMAVEILEDRRLLEGIAEYPVVGMSYPSGSYSAEVMNVLRASGIVYSRTTRSTGNFHLPEDFLAWHPTCHHKDAVPQCERFLKNLDSEWYPPLLYIWGHSHELKTQENWDYMEKLLSLISGNEKIWYATNLEIYHYITAQRRLRISVDETVFYNPSDIDVYVEKNKEQVICIPACATVRL